MSSLTAQVRKPYRDSRRAFYLYSATPLTVDFRGKERIIAIVDDNQEEI